MDLIDENASRQIIIDVSRLVNLKANVNMARQRFSDFQAHPIAWPSSGETLRETRRDLVWAIDDAEVCYEQYSKGLVVKYSNPELRKRLVHLKMQDPTAYYWSIIAPFIQA